MFVCHCRGVSDRTVAACVAGGASTIREIAERCGAGSRCGGCHPLLDDLLREHELALPARRVTAA